MSKKILSPSSDSSLLQGESPLTKVCSFCNVIKSLDDFYTYPRPDGKRSYRAQCKRCVLTYNYYKHRKNPEKRRAAALSWYYNNKERAKENRKRFLEKNPNYSIEYNKYYNMFMRKEWEEKKDKNE